VSSVTIDGTTYPTAAKALSWLRGRTGLRTLAELAPILGTDAGTLASVQLGGLAWGHRWSENIEAHLASAAAPTLEPALEPIVAASEPKRPRNKKPGRSRAQVSPTAPDVAGAQPKQEPSMVTATAPVRPNDAETHPGGHGTPPEAAMEVGGIDTPPPPPSLDGPPATSEGGNGSVVDLGSFQSADAFSPLGQDAVDMESFMVDDEEAELLGGEHVWDEVPVVKPNKKSPILVHPDVGLRVQLLSYEDDEGMESSYYLVTPSAGAYIPELVMPIIYVPFITPKGTVKLWPIKARRDQKGEMNKWSRSALGICNKYPGRWVRVIPDDGFYRCQFMKMNHEPAWPEELSQQALIDRAFGDKLIRDKSHPIIRHMLGE